MSNADDDNNKKQHQLSVSSSFVKDAPTPFLNDKNFSEAIAYDKNQIVFTALQVAATPNRKSSLEMVWNELVSYWSTDKNYRFFQETRDENIICAAHGWLLEEVYFWKNAEYNNLNNGVGSTYIS